MCLNCLFVYKHTCISVCTCIQALNRILIVSVHRPFAGEHGYTTLEPDPSLLSQRGLHEERRVAAVETGGRSGGLISRCFVDRTHQCPNILNRRCLNSFPNSVYAWGSNLFPIGVGVNFGAPKWPLPGGCPTGCPAVARFVARLVAWWLLLGSMLG